MKANGRAVDDGELGEKSRIGGEELGREIVRSLQDDVGAFHQVQSVLGQKARPVGDDPGPTLEHVGRGVEFVPPDIPVAIENLTVQVLHGDLVIIDEDESTNASMSQRERRWATEPTEADQQSGPIAEGVLHDGTSSGKYSSRLK